MPLKRKTIILALVFTLLGCINNIEVNKYKTKAEIAERNGNFQEAINFYDKILELSPNDEGAYIMKGYNFLQLNSPKKALCNYQQGKQINPKNEWAYVGISNVFSELGEFEKAINYLDTAIIINPKSSIIYQSRGIAYQFLKKHTQALTDFNKALSISPQSPSILVDKSTSELELEQYNQAIKNIKSSIQLYPNNSDAYRNWAIFLYKTNRIDSACLKIKESLNFKISQKKLNEINTLEKQICQVTSRN